MSHARANRRQDRRLRAGLRRHGLARRPPAIAALAREQGLHFSEGNRVELYGEGRIALSAMLDAIRAADHRIHLETYILRTDETGRRFLDALAERARAGVAVRVLYDGFGSLGLDSSALAPLREAGADIVSFNQLRRFYPRWAPRRRDHRKILCVDGHVGFAGGLNIGDEYWGNDGAGWRDTHLRIEGPAVRDLEAVFLESWFRADGPEMNWRDLLDTPSGPMGDVRCAVVADGPVYRRRRMRELVLSGLTSARHQVRLASPYFAPGRRVLRALADGAEHVDIDLVVAGRTDHPILRRAAHVLLPRLLTAGVRVFEYEAEIMHAKVALFDESWAIVGSSNLDRQSFEHAYEVNLVLQGGDVAQEIGEMFDRDVKRSRVVDIEALASRSFAGHILDRLCALVLRFI